MIRIKQRDTDLLKVFGDDWRMGSTVICDAWKIANLTFNDWELVGYITLYTTVLGIAFTFSLEYDIE